MNASLKHARKWEYRRKNCLSQTLFNKQFLKKPKDRREENRTKDRIDYPRIVGQLQKV